MILQHPEMLRQLVSTLTTQTTWLADGITHTIETIEELKATFEKHSHEINANACLVHALTLASIGIILTTIQTF